MKTSWTTKQSTTQAHKYLPNEQPLDPNKICAIRYAIYDNNPQLKSFTYETTDGKPRYKIEVQLWETTNLKCTHQLIGYASKLKTFGNLRYNKRLLEYNDFYQSAFENARALEMDKSANDLALHTGLGRRHAHSSRQNGYSLVPQMTASMLMSPGATPMIRLQFCDLTDVEELDNVSYKNDFTLYYKYKEVEI
jgi:hypothetical protein